MLIGREYIFTAKWPDYDSSLLEEKIRVHAQGYTEALEILQNYPELKGNPTITFVGETY